MVTNNLLLRASKRKKTILDKVYSSHIYNIISNLDEEEEDRWETYNLIITELLNTDSKDYFDEVKYRLTDGENPNQVILDIINRDLDNVNGLVWLLKRRIEEYIEEDFIRRFYI
jgi:hypothetical protein